jgi:hypothetical protein|tara:strand:- start:203 stop:385 length:183 start_codon:yes stop_codon:yes gene_type:complete
MRVLPVPPVVFIPKKLDKVQGDPGCRKIKKGEIRHDIDTCADSYYIYNRHGNKTLLDIVC